MSDNEKDGKKIEALGWEKYAQVFACLGDPERRRILRGFAPGEEKTASAVAEASELSRPAVSHHLGILSRSGCLTRRKSGREVYYGVDAAELKAAFGEGVAYAELMGKKPESETS